MAMSILLKICWRLQLIFIKSLFGYEPKPKIHLSDHFWSKEEMVFQEENISLEKPFSEEEIKKAIMSSYAGGAPDPDGL